jgi:hypothetical protein
MECTGDHKNEILSGIIIGTFGGAAAGICLWIFGVIKDKFILRSDKNKILAYLKTQIDGTEGKKFRTSRNIASFTNLPIDRVNYVCSIHNKICLSTGDKEDTWGLWGISRQAN